MNKKRFSKKTFAFLLSAMLAFHTVTAGAVVGDENADTKQSTATEMTENTTATENTTEEEATNSTSGGTVGEAVDSTGVVQLSNEKAVEQAIYPESKEEIMGHKRILSKGNYEMYLKEETLSILIRDKRTGVIMESTVQDNDGKSNAAWQGFMQSGIAIELQEDVNTQQPKLDLINSGAEIDVTVGTDGFVAKIVYPKQQISLELQVTFNDDGSFVAKIPDDSIVEESEKSKIGNIYVYPFLGYTYLGERKGYMLVPDGNGALINLEDKEG
ncbi:MAG TPA: hypothetical protein DIT54_05100, partial [Lachnospiraceae bacterium]|nr:hypothetical protein [Lachnospiraceae bacterium]